MQLILMIRLLIKKVSDNINTIPESTEIINQKNKNVSKNANTKNKKIKKKTVCCRRFYGKQHRVK